MRYTPNSGDVVTSMLHSIGLSRPEELFSDIPDEIKLNRPLELQPGMSELALRRELKKLADLNADGQNYPCFLGAGCYDHYIPAAVEQLSARAEFYTAYTPYQPEISQGILQSIFEYQSLICRLTGMDVANASVYDGGSALGEACKMAWEQSKRRRIILPPTLNPDYAEIATTYSIVNEMKMYLLPDNGSGVIDLKALEAAADDSTAAVVVQYPNFFGHLEDIAAIEKIAHRGKGLLIMVVDPIALACLKTPGAWGADIAVGDGQPLGNPMSFGGPHLGFMAVTNKLMRKVPGRLVGQTTDHQGRRAFVLTLQAREQHIRREKANSNICSNQALNALTAAMYMAMVGPEGLAAVARRSHEMAVYAAGAMRKAGLKLRYDQPFFREFAVEVNEPGTVNQYLLQNGIIGGYELNGALLFAFTEKRTKAEIDELVDLLGGVANA
ncbi:MAG: aminomethyl-transferring glycine dehydrogenase subunit GcvPA [Syntrophomonadaceae bacterium]|nr:aminomethyl-transferring glycine dehydrogenase subunit GcvPA [Syntrophomonadaceae bacterium]